MTQLSLIAKPVPFLEFAESLIKIRDESSNLGIRGQEGREAYRYID